MGGGVTRGGPAKPSSLGCELLEGQYLPQNPEPPVNRPEQRNEARLKKKERAPTHTSLKAPLHPLPGISAHRLLLREPKFTLAEISWPSRRRSETDRRPLLMTLRGREAAHTFRLLTLGFQPSLMTLQRSGGPHLPADPKFQGH